MPGNGITGYNSSGTGVFGQGSTIGLSGYATDTYGYGVYGSSGYTGVYGYGSTYGIYGYGGTYGIYGYGNSYGIFGYSSSGNGGYFTSYSGTALYASTSTGFYAAELYGNVYTSGTYYGSDKNLKKNIQEFGNAISIISKLKPKYYEFKNEAKYASLNLPKGNHYGLLAQDLQEVLPNLVSESSHELRTVKPITAIKPVADGKPSGQAAEPQATKESINIKAVNYTELIPIIVKAMQEQQATIEKQNAKIEDLTLIVTQLQNSNPQTSVKLSGVSLGQNIPNPPTANSTRINYNIPSNSASAELIFTNAADQKVKQVQLNRNGAGTVNLDTSSLSAGTYFYTLYVNGKSFDTKKMVVNR